MSADHAVKARTIVAGAAHGAWMALLVGAVLAMVGWAAAPAMFAYYPDLISTLTNAPVDQVWGLTLRWMTGLKLFLVGWVVFASFLSFWWRAL
jgi:hypothetical protein